MVQFCKLLSVTWVFLSCGSLKRSTLKISVYECVSVQHVHAWGPWRPEEASGPPVSGVTVVSHHMAAGTQTQPGSS